MLKAMRTTMEIDYLIGLLSSRFGLTVYSLLVGILGSVLLPAFFLLFLSPAAVAGLLPWIIGFNAAMTGYMIVEKTGGQRPYQRTVAAGAGVVMAVAAVLTINESAVYLTGSALAAPADLALAAVVGPILSTLGAVLAAKYIDLRSKG